ncbi:MAG: S8 family peptidase [Lachnospiraceae bacterium]|nr:S8 family peptidase [Lachnospiraceae bacterium]
MTCKEKILSNEYADLITDYVMADDLSATTPVDFCFHEIDEYYGVANVNRAMIPPMSIGVYSYTSIPSVYGLMQIGDGIGGQFFNPESLAETGSIRVQNPPLSLQGSGVILGFVDTGIRYELDVFRREDGSSRIMAIWDQTIQDGEPPEGFLYGTEYRRADIDLALQTSVPKQLVPTTDTNGHGTQIASVAAGSILNQGLTFRGAAPLADIAVVKVKEAKQYLRDYYLIADDAVAYQENDIMEAVSYLERMAIAMRRPVVIVLGIGTNLGSHNGTSPLASYLNIVAGRRSRAVVVCGGNEGDKEHHYVSAVPDVVEVRVAEETKGFCLELWGTLPETYAVRVRSPGGETSQEIDFRSRRDREIEFIFEKTRIMVSNLIVERDAGEPLIFFRFEDPTPGIWNLRIFSSEDGAERGTGVFHLWLPISEFLDTEVVFLSPSPDVTLTEPSNAERVITISSYDAASGSWFPQSGRGYAKNGMIKPDLCAPGVQVSTALGAKTGACMAAALAAGCAAQFMEWAVVDGYVPAVESRGVKSYLIRGADRSENIVYPDRRWGFGKIDIIGTFENLAKLE